MANACLQTVTQASARARCWSRAVHTLLISVTACLIQLLNVNAFKARLDKFWQQPWICSWTWVVYSELKGRYALPVHMSRTYGCIFDIRTYCPYLRPVCTSHTYGQYIWAIFTGSAYRP